MAKNGKIWPFSMVHKSLNTHGTLSVYLLCRLLTVSCFQKNRFGEIVNSGSQSNSKVQSTLNKQWLIFIKWNNFGRQSNEKWHVTDGHYASRLIITANNDWHSTYGLWRVVAFDVTTECCLNIKCNWRVLCKNFGNQTIIDIQICLTNYEGLFHLMLRLDVASTSNEIIMIGIHMNKGNVTIHYVTDGYYARII